MSTNGCGSVSDLRHVHRDHPQWHPDLNGSKTHARRIIHRFEHIVREPPDLVGDGRYRLGNEAQLGVGKDDERSDGHDGGR